MMRLTNNFACRNFFVTILVLIYQGFTVFAVEKFGVPRQPEWHIGAGKDY